MVYKATQDVVRRVMPLLDQLAVRTVDKARLLQYLSARAGADWGALELVDEVEEETEAFGGARKAFVFRDPISGGEHRIPFPVCLPEEIDALVRDEYKRLAADQPLTVMSQQLFRRFYEAGYCASCRWRGEEHAQIHRECHFAGRPINYEPVPDEMVG